MASIQEQLEALRKEKEVITTTGLGASDATTYLMQGDLDRINKQIDDLKKVLTLGASGTGMHMINVLRGTGDTPKLGDFYSESEDINLLDQDRLEQGNLIISDEFKELSPKGSWGADQRDVLQDLLDNLPPHLESYRPMLQRKLDLAGAGQQISFLNPSSSQYLINQQKNLGITNPWLNAIPGVQVASTGNLTGMGIPNALQRQRRQAELMQAGNLALNQTPAQVQAQVAAAQATQQENYQAPTMTQQQMVQEAQQTGGTVNPHEATQAAYSPPQPSSYSNVRKYGRADGGMVSLMDLLNRRV